MRERGGGGAKVGIVDVYVGMYRGRCVFLLNVQILNQYY